VLDAADQCCRCGVARAHVMHCAHACVRASVPGGMRASRRGARAGGRFEAALRGGAAALRVVRRGASRARLRTGVPLAVGFEGVSRRARPGQCAAPRHCLRLARWCPHACH
jgi:hypothetical protein